MTGKPLDFRILAELFKDSRTSNKQLAKAIGTSESAVSRARARVEKNLIDGYTLIPKWNEIDFEIAAFTFVRSRNETYLERGKHGEAFDKAEAWFERHPNVVLASSGEGLGWNALIVSFHKSYSEFVKFKKEHDEEFRDLVADTQSFIVDISPSAILKSFHLKYLADTL